MNVQKPIRNPPSDRSEPFHTRNSWPRIVQKRVQNPPRKDKQLNSCLTDDITLQVMPQDDPLPRRNDPHPTASYRILPHPPPIPLNEPCHIHASNEARHRPLRLKIAAPLKNELGDRLKLQVCHCNCRRPFVTAFCALVHRGEGGDAPSARCGDTVCNITSKTQNS
jgi:hypothetical protein